MKFSWGSKDSLLEKARAKIYSKEHQARMKRMDFLFDLSGMSLFLFHLFLSFPGLYYQVFPAWLMVLFFWITRTGLSAIGHYHSHRKKDGITDWGDALFDI